MEEKKPLVPLKEISRQDLKRQDAVYFLGLCAANQLEKLGIAVFTLSPDGKVAMPNPTHVYLDADAYMNEDIQSLPPFKWVRPILGQGKPQYVAWRNGELWEIEFEEPTITGDRHESSE